MNQNNALKGTGMKTAGGCTILLHGKPDSQVLVPPATDVLCIPRKSKRFLFSVLCIKDGQQVRRGTVLALDPSSFSVPLLSPCCGTARTTVDSGYIKIERD